MWCIDQVRASAVLVPEGSNPGAGPDTDRYLFAYSIRMSLLPQGCMLDGANYSSCQLRSRHWIIRSRESIVDDVRGEAVTGNVIILFFNFSLFWYLVLPILKVRKSSLSLFSFCVWLLCSTHCCFLVWMNLSMKAAQRYQQSQDPSRVLSLLFLAGTTQKTCCIHRQFNMYLFF